MNNISDNTQNMNGKSRGRLAKNNLVDLFEKLEKFYLNIEKSNIVFYGAGANCKNTLDFFTNENIKMPIAICDKDRNKYATNVSGIEIMSIDDVIKKNDNFYVVITPLNYLDEIYTDLSKIVPKERIIYDTEIFIYLHHKQINNIGLLLADKKSKEIYFNILLLKINNKICEYSDLSTLPQYFQDDIYKLNEDDVFLDVGAFKGDTIETLEEITNGKYKKIISCEPNPDFYIYIEKMMEINPKIHLIKKVFLIIKIHCYLVPKKEIQVL